MRSARRLEMNWWYGAVAAFQFLTRIPIPISFAYTDRIFRRSVVFFPLVGAVLGALLYAAGIRLCGVLPVLPASVMLLILWTAWSGGLHLDGLMDSADGLLSHRSPERMLEIMKDSRVGAMGVIVCVLALLLKLSLLTALLGGSAAPTAEASAAPSAAAGASTAAAAGTSAVPSRGAAAAGPAAIADGAIGTAANAATGAAAGTAAGTARLHAGTGLPIGWDMAALAPIWSRWFMAAAIASWPYARKEQGLGSLYRSTGKRHIIAGAVLAAALSTGWLYLCGHSLTNSLTAAACFGLTAAFAGWLGARTISAKLGGLTGDTYGALNEMLEIVLLAAAFWASQI